MFFHLHCPLFGHEIALNEVVKISFHLDFGHLFDGKVRKTGVCGFEFLEGEVNLALFFLDLDP